jgi:hypothetical protein
MKDMRALAYRTETVIRRSPEEVFDFCSDLRSELRWNPKAKYVEKLTHGPATGRGGPPAAPPPSRSWPSIALEAGRPPPGHGAWASGSRAPSPRRR